MADRWWNPAAAGNWGDTSSWAATEGGATGETVPTSSDDVYFSSTNNNQCTVNVTANCNNLDFGDWTGTYLLNQNLSAYGSVVFSGAMTMTAATFKCLYLASASDFTLTCNGLQLSAMSGFGYIYKNGLGSTLTLADDFTLERYANINIAAGNFDTDGFTIDCYGLSSISSTAVYLRASIINILGNGGCALNSNTLNAGTSTINNYGSGKIDFYSKNNAYNINQLYGGDSKTEGIPSLNNLTINPGAAYAEATIDGNLTITGTLTLTGNSDRYRLWIGSDTPGTARTITAANVSAQYVDFEDITGAGAGDWDLSTITGGSGNCGGNSGITFSSARDLYWVGDSGITYDSAEWASSSGGSGGAGVPRAQDTLHFDSNSFSTTGQTVSIGLRRHGTMDWTGVTNSPTININFVSNYYGSLTLVSGMSVTGTSAIYFSGRSTHTITMAGKSFASSSVVFSCPGGTYTFQDAFTNDGTIYFQYGTLDFNDFDVTCQVFNSNYNNTRTLNMGSGTLTLTGTGYVWYIGQTSLTLNEETSTIKATNNSSSTKYFRGQAAATYYNLWIATLGTGNFDMYDNYDLTFNQIKISEGAKLRFKAGKMVTVSDFVADGTSAITITSSTSATHTLSCASGTIDVSYCTISYSIATGGATFNAWTSLGNTDGGNNTGWIFTEPSGAQNTSNFFYFMGVL